MSEESSTATPNPAEGAAPAPKPRKGGLGRGLGALIPSAPLGNASGKGHFWNVLDNPPTIDPANLPPTPTSASPVDVPPVDVSRETAESVGADTTPEAGTPPTDERPQRPTASDSDSSTAVPAEDSTAASPSDSESVGAGPASAAPTETDLADAAAVLVEIDPADIDANPKNPRQVFDDDDLAELSASVAEFGLLQPIVVRTSPTAPDRYELVMGERRLRAARLAGLDLIPAIVRQTDDDAMLRDALLENIHRVQLHPLEEAAAYQQLIDEFGVTHEELATRIKRSRPAISNSIRLLKLPVRVQNRVAAGVISGSHARALLGLSTVEEQEALATRIVAEGLSVRATEEAVALTTPTEPARRQARRPKLTAPALAGLAERLSDHFDTRALVQIGRAKGKIVVEFASIDDLERIIAMMAPPLATNRLAAQIAADEDEDENENDG